MAEEKLWPGPTTPQPDDEQASVITSAEQLSPTAWPGPTVPQPDGDEGVETTGGGSAA